MKQQHTKGPWKSHPSSLNQILGYDDCEEQTSKTVAICHGYTSKEVFYNTCLIKAAPSMLEVLERAQHYQENAAIKKMMVDVIALARGELS